MGTTIAIAMATWNGAAHVEEQVRSLQAQDVRDWRLFVRDDGSTDGTPAIVARLAAQDPRIELLPRGERLGVVGNFGRLLEHARAQGAAYVFPCDQDDVWVPSKLSRMLARMSELEARHGRRTPLLVHSDLAVVDEALRERRPSFLRFQGIRHEETSPLEVLLVQNFVTGCASLVNRALLELALPLPGACVVHDWWLALCAAADGRIGFDPGALVRYRQHGANQIGAGGALGNLAVLRASGRRRFARSWRVAVQTVWQARALEERLGERGRAGVSGLAAVGAYAKLDAARPLERLRTLRRFGIRRQRPLGTALLYVRVALLGVEAPRGPSTSRA